MKKEPIKKTDLTIEDIGQHGTDLRLLDIYLHTGQGLLEYDNMIERFIHTFLEDY